MAIVYGSIVKPAALQQSDVATFIPFQPKQTLPWWYYLAKVGLTVVGVASIFAGPIAAVIGAAASTAGEAVLDYEVTGDVNIGQIVGGAIGTLGFGALGVFGRELGALTSGLASVGIMAGTNVASELGSYLQFGQKPTAAQLGIDWGLGVGIPLLGTGISAFKIQRLRARQILSLDIESVTKQEVRQAFSEIQGLQVNQQTDILSGTRRQIKQIRDQISEFKDVSNQLELLLSAKSQEEVTNIYNNNIRNAIKQTANITDIELEAIIEALSRVQINNEADAVKLLTSIVGEEKALQIAASTARNMEILNAQIKATILQQTQREGSVLAKVNRVSKVVAHKTYELVKMVTPRELAEMIAKKSAKQINKILKKTYTRFKRTVKKVQSLEKWYVQTGGNLIDSTVILGYKVIMNQGFENLIQLTFRPSAFHVKDKTAKNYGGKKPVYIRATASQIHKLKKDGFEYYLEDWAMSRGGKSVGDSFIGEILGKSEMLLSYLPLEQLREVIKLTSLVRGNFKYFADVKEWGHKFSEEFTKSWKITVRRTVPHLLPTGTIANATQPLIKAQLKNLTEGEWDPVSPTIGIASSTGKRISRSNDRYRKSLREFKTTQRHARQIRRLGTGATRIFR